MTTDIAEVLAGPENGSQALRFRSAQLEGVNFPARIIELMVTPYEEEALVPWQGRMVTEIFSQGAYDGIERRASRVKANREHDVRATVGRVLRFRNSEAGLAAELKIAKTELGDETLALADEECLDASAGYLPMKDGEQWENRNRVRIRKAWLGHVALVAEPAYEGARVLAVRNAALAAEGLEKTPTPYLDEVRGWRLSERYAKLD